MQMYEHWCDEWIDIRLSLPKVKLDAKALILSFQSNLRNFFEVLPQGTITVMIAILIRLKISSRLTSFN